ncbi:type VII secretion target [Mycobacterium sp. DL440]|uniref:type VII secretion target n=1 Tax=Mycobacterium sp. DL440 TaxID=2675523 RepID=UPI00141FC6F9|nr:type VII secretion target [Mycobacterium sp. DL440]
MNQLVANTGAITGLQGVVGGVSEDMNNFKNAFSGPSDLASSHGPIGSFVQGAVGGANSSRDGALGATQQAAGRMADLLGQASKAYDRGDLNAAERLKAQADALSGSGSAASTGGGASGAGAGGGADGAGQMMGQFSQMAGQMMQSVTQPLQGLSQAMTQVPQQVMQGVQGIVEAATQAAGGGGDAAATAADVGGMGADEAIKANATGHQGPGDGPGEGSDGGPSEPHDGKDDKKDDAEHRKHDGESDRRAEAGASALGHNEQLGDRASVGVRPEDGYGAGAVPTQVHNISPRRQ